MALVFISLIIWGVENLLTYFVGYPNVFFEKNVFGDSLPTFYWIVYGFFLFCFLFVAVELFGFFIYMLTPYWINDFADIFCDYLDCLFILLMVFFLCTEAS